MERLEPYKGFQIRAYEDWSGLWLAETKKPLGRRPGAGDHDDTDAEYIATPSGHPTPENIGKRRGALRGTLPSCQSCCGVLVRFPANSLAQYG